MAYTKYNLVCLVVTHMLLSSLINHGVYIIRLLLHVKSHESLICYEMYVRCIGIAGVMFLFSLKHEIIVFCGLYKY